MNQTEYEALCRKAETLAENNPVGYRRKLFALSMLGHLVLFGLLASLIAIVIALGFIAVFWSGLFLLLIKKKIFLFILPVIFIIARALWVKFDRPSGHVLTREEFPALFNIIDELGTELKTPPIHQVLLTDEFNASITQTPRLGVFGWQHNTLTLGLTLLLTLSPEQARSVIAHELGHLSASHSAFAGRIYRSRIAWERVMSAMGENDSFGGAIVYRFFSWYAPRFSAYSFALARQNEYEADTIAANLTSPEEAGGALIAVHTMGNRINNGYWKSLYSTADHILEPDKQPWRKLKDYIAVDRSRDTSKDLQLAMSYTSDYGDTHPSLTQRLANLNIEPKALPDVEVSAASQWFGGSIDGVLKSFDEQWVESNLDGWKARFEYAQTAKLRIKELEMMQLDTLDSDTMLEKISLWGEFKTDDEFVELLNAGVEQFPDNTKCRFLRGRWLAHQGDEGCLKDLEVAVKDDDVSMDVCAIAYHFLADRDRLTDAEPWRLKAEALQQELQVLHEQQHMLTAKDKMRKVQLSEEQRAELIASLKASKLVRKVWIAEKLTPEGVPSSIALAVTSKRLIIFSETKFIEKVGASIPNFDGWVFQNSGENKALAKKVRKIKDRLI